MAEPITWNSANNSIAATANALITVKDTLTGLGIEVTDLCNTDDILQALQKLLKEWLDDVKKTVDNITFEMVGNFLTTLGVLLAQLIASAAASFTNMFLLEILAGNLLNSIVAAIAFSLALIPGAEIVLQYYLVSTLKRDLYRRNELGDILEKEFIALIGLFSSFYELFKLEDDLLYKDMRKALNNIRRAERIIGKEVSKNFNGKEPLQIDNISTADSLVETAINQLTHGNYTVVNTYITNINNQYGITANVPQDLDVKSWVTYFDTLQPFITFRFFTYDKQPGESGYEEESRAKQEAYVQFMSAMMKVMPPVLQRIILNSTFKKSSNVIFERIPVWANNIKILKDIKGFIDNTLSVSDKFLNTYMLMNNSRPAQEPALFKNPATKDITWRNITSKIRIEEAGTLLFPSYWDYIKNVGGLLQNILLPVLGILKSVDTEIDDVLRRKEKLSTVDVSVKQFVWLEQLTMARGLMATIINSTEINTMYGGIEFSPLEVYNLTVQADVQMSKLQQFIKDKSFDSKTQTPKTQAADIVYDTAQKYLGSLMTNMYIIINPAVAKNTISGLQSMRVAIGNQKAQDRAELKLCNAYLSTVEANPMFRAAKPYIDKLLNDLEQNPTWGPLINQLKTGDLSGIIGILEGYHLTEEIISIINCENSKTEEFTDPDILGLGSELSGEMTINMKRALAYLNDKKAMFDAVPQIMELLNIEELTGTLP